MESLLEQELPKIVANGAFGKNIEFVSFNRNTDLVGQNHYSSLVVFGTVITSDGKKHDILIKRKIEDISIRKMKNVDSQFHNEIIMYEKVVPFLLTCRISMNSDLGGPTIPRFIYGRNSFDESVENDLIILENANSLGFRLSEERLFLDYEHLVKALQAIAKFHGLSYIAKHKDFVGFQRIIAQIREVNDNMQEGSWSYTLFNALHRFGKRGIDRLLERDGVRYRGNEYLRKFEEFVKDGVNAARRALEPREPHSVLCHGDFNRNNMLFRYVDDSGHPADTLLFDFGTLRYGSPALDLSFMLYMNTTQRVRESRWDDLLNVYCAALTASVPAGVRVPDRAALDLEMSKSAIIGFSVAMYFLPAQLSNKVPKDIKDSDIIDRLLISGGSTASEYVADMIQHIIDLAYIDV